MPKYALLIEHPSPVDTVNKGLLTDGAGSVLDDLLKWADIPRADCQVFSVFPTCPAGNNPLRFFGGSGPRHHKFGRLRDDLVPVMGASIKAVVDYAPDVVVAFGTMSLMALTGESRLSEYRGTPFEAYGLPIIATESPSSVLKQWSLRPVIAMDLAKAKRLASTKSFAFPVRKVMIAESPADVEAACARCREAGTFAFDVETAEKQITCISLGVSPSEVYVVPIWNYYRPGRSHWSADEEWAVWLSLSKLFADPRVAKVAHNAVYDITYLNHHGVAVVEPVHDTMFMAHAYQIEWPKGLGFLGSLHTDERSWKLLRVGAKKNRNKADE